MLDDVRDVDGLGLWVQCDPDGGRQGDVGGYGVGLPVDHRERVAGEVGHVDGVGLRVHRDIGWRNPAGRYPDGGDHGVAGGVDDRDGT